MELIYAFFSFCGLLLILAIIVMDGLTYGGLFKNPLWQFLRNLWRKKK